MNQPKLLILNQMAGPMTWELAEDAGESLGCVAMLTGHPDTLAKATTEKVQLYPAASYVRGSFACRAWSWFQYSWQAFFWLWRWPKEIPILLFSNPPILCWLGWLMKKLRRQHYAVMVHDIYPNVLVSVGGFSKNNLLIRSWLALNRRAYENAQVVMTLGEFMAANLEKQFDPTKTPAGKVEVVYPWVDTEKIKPMPKAENWFAQKYNQVDKLTVMYSGNMGLGHDIEAMLEAARLLQDEPKIHFMFIGAGPKWSLVDDYKKKKALKNITLLGWQSEEVLPFSLACADITLVSLELGVESIAVPSKAIYALAVGSLLISLSSPNGELANWLKVFNCGKNIFPGDFESLKDVIANATISFLGFYKKNNRIVSEDKFSRIYNVKNFFKIFHSFFYLP